MRIESAYGWSWGGCCWALILLMFGLGTTNIAWMVMLGTIMAVEKDVPRARGVSRLRGLGLVVFGVLHLFGG